MLALTLMFLSACPPVVLPPDAVPAGGAKDRPRQGKVLRIVLGWYGDDVHLRALTGVDMILSPPDVRIRQSLEGFWVELQDEARRVVAVKRVADPGLIEGPIAADGGMGWARLPRCTTKAVAADFANEPQARWVVFFGSEDGKAARELARFALR